MDNKGKKLLIAMISLFVLLACLGGCGGNEDEKKPAEATPTVTLSVTATSTPSPTPAREPENYSPAELYKKTEADNVYLLYTAEPSAERPELYLTSVNTAGDYVLFDLYMTDSEGDNPEREYVMFHLGRPDLTRKLKPEYNPYRSFLLDDGTAVLLDLESTAVYIYNREFELVSTVDTGSANLSDVTSDKTLWYKNYTTTSLDAYDFNGNLKASYPCDKEIYGIMTLDDGRTLFRAFNPVGATEIYYADKGSTELKPFMESQAATTVCDGYFYQENTMFFTILRDTTDDGVYFAKKMFNESIDSWCGKRLLTTGREPGEGMIIDGQNVNSTYVFNVYDVDRYTVVNGLASSELPAYTDLNAVRINDRGYVLIEGKSGDSHVLLLWDTTAEEAKPIGNVCKTSEKSYRECAKDIFKEIEKQYGAHVLFEEEDIRENPFTPWYTIDFVQDDRDLLELAISVSAMMEKYPTGFWTELLAGNRDCLDIYLTGSMENPENGFIASGVVLTSGESLAVAFSKGAVLGGFNTMFAHEVMHLMEHRIEQYFEENGYSWMAYWAGELVSEKYPYKLEAILSDARDENVWKEQYGNWRNSETENVWYVRTYGSWNQLEDRATVMEALFDKDMEAFEKCAHLRDKGRAICAAIRAAFPCVEGSKVPTLWECMGIVDPEEFKETWSKYPMVAQG